MAAEKCPECGTWWRGLNHRCAAVTTSTTNVPHLAPPFQPDIELIDNAEGNRKIRDADRRKATVNYHLEP